MSIDVAGNGARLSDRIAEEIRALLARRRMSGRELARRLGVSPSWLSYRLTGAQPIDLNDLEQIAAALNVDVVELFTDVQTRARRSNKDVSHRPVSPPPPSRPNGGRPPGHPVYELLPRGQRRPQRSDRKWTSGRFYERPVSEGSQK